MENLQKLILETANIVQNDDDYKAVEKFLDSKILELETDNAEDFKNRLLQTLESYAYVIQDYGRLWLLIKEWVPFGTLPKESNEEYLLLRIRYNSIPQLNNVSDVLRKADFTIQTNDDTVSVTDVQYVALNPNLNSVSLLVCI